MQLIVIADQIVGGARDGDAGFEETHLQVSQVFCATPIDVSNQRGHFDSALGCGLQLDLYIGSVKAKNGDLDRFLGLLDRRQ